MEPEASLFETSEMLASLLGSTPLVSESWKLCRRSNVMAPQGFLSDEIGGVIYVAFSGVQSVDGLDPFWGNLVPLVGVAGVFSGELQKEGDDVMVDAGLLNLFLGIYHTPVFQNQMFEIKKKGKAVVFTGHSMGGAMASLSSLWLLSYLESISSPPSVLCITFGSPLLGNEPLSRAIQRHRWGRNFCHLVSKHDIIPRLFFAPLAPINTHLHSLLKSCHLTISSPFFILDLATQIPQHDKSELFHFVLHYVEAIATSKEMNATSSFFPFGNFVFCSSDGAVCIDDAIAIVKMLHLTFASGSPTSSIQDHLEYENYVTKITSQFLNRTQEDLCESNTYEAGVSLASQSISSGHEPTIRLAKVCLKMARRVGRTPNLNSAGLAIGLSKITPLRAQIEWYKASCDESDDQMGYYDSFKLRGASRRDFKVLMNQIKLGEFWNNVIHMLETNQLPHDFHKRAKWVNASQFYKLLVEPLDIAEYYRSRDHRVKGHYMKHGRSRRYEIFDKWWRERDVFEEHNDNNRRSKYASLTQDSCFWAKVEEAKEWLENVRSESDPRRLAVLWESIDKFEQYARGLVERKEVSIDVVAKNSSYMVWVEELKVLKLHLQRFSTQILGVLDEKVVP